MAAQIAGTNGCKIGCWLERMTAPIAGTNACKIGCWLGQIAAQIDGTNGCNIGCWDKSLHRLLGQMAAKLVAE